MLENSENSIFDGENHGFRRFLFPLNCSELCISDNQQKTWMCQKLGYAPKQTYFSKEIIFLTSKFVGAILLDTPISNYIPSFGGLNPIVLLINNPDCTSKVNSHSHSYSHQ